jgi:nucleoside-diphosphate-sugar epimerase
MKILVTGATGFIGAAIARKLSQQRHEIWPCRGRIPQPRSCEPQV